MSGATGRRGPGFQRAVRLAEAVTAIGEGRLGDAEPVIEAVIELDPGAPEGYWLRASVHRQLGRYAEAARDWTACISRDPHFLEAEKLRQAVESIRREFLTDPVLDAVGDGPEPARARSEDLALLLAARASALAERRQLLARPACSLPCRSACCYFDEEPSVFIEPPKIDLLREFLRRRHLAEAEYVGRAPASECAERIGEERSVVYVSSDNGGPGAYYLRRDERKMPLAYSDRPRRLDLRALPWLNAASRACRFIGDGGCLLHELGDPPGVGTCREFLCLTGFVFTILKYLGAVSPEELATRAIADLHERALRLLPLLHESFAGQETSARLACLQESLKSANDADLEGKPDRVSAAVARCHSAESMLAVHHERQLAVLRAAVVCPQPRLS